MQAVAGFVFDRVFGVFLCHLSRETATLHHEARDYPVENGVGVETAVDVFQKVLAADRCFYRVQFDFNFPEAGVQQYMRRLGRCRRGSHQVGSKQQGTSGEGNLFKHGSVILKSGVTGLCHAGNGARCSDRWTGYARIRFLPTAVHACSGAANAASSGAVSKVRNNSTSIWVAGPSGLSLLLYRKNTGWRLPP